MVAQALPVSLPVEEEGQAACSRRHSLRPHKTPTSFPFNYSPESVGQQTHATSLAMEKARDSQPLLPMAFLLQIQRQAPKQQAQSHLSSCRTLLSSCSLMARSSLLSGFRLLFRLRQQQQQHTVIPRSTEPPSTDMVMIKASKFTGSPGTELKPRHVCPAFTPKGTTSCHRSSSKHRVWARGSCQPMSIT